MTGDDEASLRKTIEAEQAELFTRIRRGYRSYEEARALHDELSTLDETADAIPDRLRTPLEQLERCTAFDALEQHLTGYDMAVPTGRLGLHIACHYLVTHPYEAPRIQHWATKIREETIPIIRELEYAVADGSVAADATLVSTIRELAVSLLGHSEIIYDTFDDYFQQDVHVTLERQTGAWPEARARAPPPELDPQVFFDDERVT